MHIKCSKSHELSNDHGSMLRLAKKITCNRPTFEQTRRQDLFLGEVEWGGDTDPQTNDARGNGWNAGPPYGSRSKALFRVSLVGFIPKPSLWLQALIQSIVRHLFQK